ncbi:MAG: iron chaperone [Paludibacteraceae bacterium]
MDEYLADFSPEIVERLTAIRSMVHEIVPEAEEGISYAMPAFKYKKRILIYFAAFKNHIGFYALPSGKDAFTDKLTMYKTSKGTIQFSHRQPLPMDLIREIVAYRVMEIGSKSTKK